jgi:chorismate mutase
MTCRGIRGAITVETNTENTIIQATIRLLTALIHKNNMDETDIVSIFFSITDDLNAAFPARAAREMNLNHTPLLCFHEVAVPNGLPKCIRILMHVNTTKSIYDMHHVYLDGAVKLRPDIASK